MLHQQLEQLHFSDSALNNNCLPDPDAEEAAEGEEKEKVKGEIVKYIIRTSAGFAVRQTQKADPNRVVSAKVSGFKRAPGHPQNKWNGTWKRCPFDYDFRPCFATSDVSAGQDPD